MNLKTGKLLCCTTALLLGPSLLFSAPIVFTGNVPVDFAGTPVSQIVTEGIDVGIPLVDPQYTEQPPAGTISGWDVHEVYFAYNADEDLLQVGMDFYGIAGDADGDGIDGHASAWLIERGGNDRPDLQYSESISVAFDFDQDGFYDKIAGEPSMLAGGFFVADFMGEPDFQPYSFGPALPYYYGGHFYTPVAASPDCEIALAHFSELDDKVDDTFCFDFRLVSGAGFSDDGIGEEIVMGTICIEDKIASAELPSSIEMLQAWPNPFNPTTNVNYSLAETGYASLKVYDLAGREVAELVNGLVGAGEHEVVFNGQSLASGIYLAVLQTESATQVQRLTLLK